MRCYLVKAPGAQRYAATNADARATRDGLVVDLAVKKSEVSIEQVDVPLAKPLLLDVLNELCQAADAPKRATADTAPVGPKTVPGTRKRVVARG